MRIHCMTNKVERKLNNFAHKILIHFKSCTSAVLILHFVIKYNMYNSVTIGLFDETVNDLFCLFFLCV